MTCPTPSILLSVLILCGFSLFAETTHHGNYYLGIIDDVRIYDRALSNAEVQDLHQLGQ
jgi:hypothetical protein